MVEPISVITLCVIGVMCLITVGRTVKDEWQEARAKRFSRYTQKTFDPASTNAKRIKFYNYLFTLLREHAESERIQTQTEARNSSTGEEATLVGDMTRFVWTRISGCQGMWLYIHPQTFAITMFCRDVTTRNWYLKRIEECLNDKPGLATKRFAVTEIWVR